MTFDPNRERKLDEKRVQAAALTLAKLADWTIDQYTVLLPRKFQHYFHIPEAELLLVPSLPPFGRTKAAVTEATREARSDAVIIMIGRNERGLVQPYLSIARWTAEQTIWYGPHLPWLYCDGEAWAVPDPRGGAEHQPCIRLSSRPIRPVDISPWATAAERYMGLARADAAFAHLQRETLR